MLLKVTAAVEANAVLDEQFAVVFKDGTKLEVTRDDDGFWCSIVLTRRIEDWREHMTQIVVHDTKPPATPTLGRGETESGPLAEMKRLLQFIESWGGYMFHVWSIDWQCPMIEWIPETEDERASPHVEKFDVHRVPVSEPRPMTLEGLMSLLRGRDLFEPYVIPMSFIRQAGIDWDSQRYLSAFFDYYHFIEGLFADGKSSEPQVVARFVGNTCLMNAAEQALDIFRGPDYDQHLVNLRVHLDEEKLAETADGILRLLVRMRGRLHHYAHKPSPKRRGHPLNESDYEALASLASVVCVGVCTRILVGDPLG